MGMEQAVPATGRAVLDCPKCKGAAPLLTPMTVTNDRTAVHACRACGYTFTADGGAFVKDTEALRDVFRAATLGQQTLVEALAGEKLNPATRVLLQAKLIEFGTQMWFDGLRQGLMLRAQQDDYAAKAEAAG